ncbi:MULTISPECIES: RHS domain-containing protein [unclassified Methylobacterium]|uniref:RHS domain-containing protein n=1 Tax=unclassified Methylobacterium TaxID=2615210 RepID=UPI0037029FF8
MRSTPGGVVQLGHGPHGERVALTHDACGRVIERRVERKGFRPRTWRYGWDVQDRLVRCVTPEGSVWHYRYDAFGRRLSKVREFSQAERAWVRAKHPGLLPASQRDGTVLWTWPQAPGGHAAHDPRAPVVGVHFLWDGDVVAEEAPLRLDGTVEWEAATRWHYEPESFVPVAKQEPDGRLAWIVTDHLGTPREMFDEAGGLRWAVSLTTWGVVRRVIVPPEPANDEGRPALYPRPRTSGNLALRSEPDAAAYD